MLRTGNLSACGFISLYLHQGRVESNCVIKSRLTLWQEGQRRDFISHFWSIVTGSNSNRPWTKTEPTTTTWHLGIGRSLATQKESRLALQFRQKTRLCWMESASRSQSWPSMEKDQVLTRDWCKGTTFTEEGQRGTAEHTWSVFSVGLTITGQKTADGSVKGRDPGRPWKRSSRRGCASSAWREDTHLGYAGGKCVRLKDVAENTFGCFITLGTRGFQLTHHLNEELLSDLQLGKEEGDCSKGRFHKIRRKKKIYFIINIFYDVCLCDVSQKIPCNFAMIDGISSANLTILLPTPDEVGRWIMS